MPQSTYDARVDGQIEYLTQRPCMHQPPSTVKHPKTNGQPTAAAAVTAAVTAATASFFLLSAPLSD
jgi:hypothetical protein